jgi:hypothetical protein
VRGEDDERTLRNVFDACDEDGAALCQVADDVRVVDDLLAHVDRSAVLLEQTLDRLDSPLDTRAIAPRGGEQDPLYHSF